MAKKGGTDIDKGYKKIIQSIKDLGVNGVNVGIASDKINKEGVSVAQYAYWNEVGVESKDGKGWKIPPRPFMRGWADSNKENIKQTMQSVAQAVSSGKIEAETAVERIGQYCQDGIKSYIRRGDFTPNSPATIEKKGSSRPLIDTGTMRNSIRYEIVRNKK